MKRLFLWASCYVLVSCSSGGYNDGIAKVNLEDYIKNSLSKPESYNSVLWTPADTLTINGRKERMSYVEFVYRDDYNKLIPIQTFAYFDLDGNVLRVERWPR